MMLLAFVSLFAALTVDRLQRPNRSRQPDRKAVYIAGVPGQGAPEAARGFVGIAFHADSDGPHFECFYLRPTNGRASDQLRRTIRRNTSIARRSRH